MSNQIIEFTSAELIGELVVCFFEVVAIYEGIVVRGKNETSSYSY